MSKQRTIAKPFTLSGRGLHTGLELTARFCPADEDTGYRICRVDLDARPIIPATAEYVVNTRLGSVYGIGDVRCSTVEHAMSAFFAMGIDNLLIEVNGPEIPILDGSAEPYMRCINDVGIVEQTADKHIIAPGEIVKVETENGSSIKILPADDFRLTVTIDFGGRFLGMQTATLNNIRDFEEEICRARTFVYVRDIEPLLAAGLIKGGNLDNAIVIYETPTTQERIDMLCKLTGVEHHDASAMGYIQHKPLVWENEPARHKLLDLIGDLAQVGAEIHGHVIATKPGHTVNNKFARKLIASS